MGVTGADAMTFWAGKNAAEAAVNIARDTGLNTFKGACLDTLFSSWLSSNRRCGDE
jgi:hypothetical protein